MEHSFVEVCVFVCVLKCQIKRDCVYIVYPCIPTILHTYVGDQKPLCKHPSLLCSSTFLNHIGTFLPSVVAVSHDAFSLLLLGEKNNTEKKR